MKTKRSFLMAAAMFAAALLLSSYGDKPGDDPNGGDSDNGQTGRRDDYSYGSFIMVKVDSGVFTMGTTSEQGDDFRDNEKPTHKITLSTYYIGKYEVTQKQWRDVMGGMPSWWEEIALLRLALGRSPLI
jgi:hypothetical protein